MTTPDVRALRVILPGLSTTVQDRGRFGWQRFGVPVSGALDMAGLAAANIVCGNGPGEAALECLYQGCEVAVEAQSVRVAAAGASLEVLDEGGECVVCRAAALVSVTALRGERVRVRLAGPGISAYLAVEGGFAVTPVLGANSTYVRAALGGFSGRALCAGDRLGIVREAASARGELRLSDVELRPAREVRVVPGPQDDHFTEDALAILTGAAYVVQAASDRMGLRLAGPKLAHRNSADIVSDGIPPGAIQVPGDGLPIIMLADRQTTGGYTKIATVISADLPGLGRVGPGAELKFRAVCVEEAEGLAREFAAEIAGWPARLVDGAGLEGRLATLYEANLISGVVDGGGAAEPV